MQAPSPTAVNDTCHRSFDLSGQLQRQNSASPDACERFHLRVIVIYTLCLNQKSTTNKHLLVFWAGKTYIYNLIVQALLIRLRYILSDY